jgi:hypothetical protein
VLLVQCSLAQGWFLLFVFTTNNSKAYAICKVEGVERVYHKDKTYVPQQLQSRVAAWCHEYSSHPGKKLTLEETMPQFLMWPGLRASAGVLQNLSAMSIVEVPENQAWVLASKDIRMQTVARS